MLPPVVSAISLALCDDLDAWARSPCGVATVQLRAQLRAGEHQRVADVVAVADVGEVEAFGGAEVLFEGHEVGEAWQGCSKSESALMTGTRELAAISVMVSCA